MSDQKEHKYRLESRVPSSKIGTIAIWVYWKPAEKNEKCLTILSSLD